MNTLIVVLVLTIVYLTLTRLMDLNEKEPFWALAMVFAIGFVAAIVLYLGADTTFLELTIFPAAVAIELARFVAITLSVAIFVGVSKRRGWSEISGLMDGVVYGMAAGLGFGTGRVLVTQLLLPAPDGIGDPLLSLGSIALASLADGLFGAIAGAGFGAAADSGSRAARLSLPLLGLALSIAVHTGYRVLVSGDAFSGSSAVARQWLGLALPIVLVAAVIIIALLGERRALREHLTEASDGSGLKFLNRRSAQVGALLRGDLDEWLALKALHNRKVQIALAKRRGTRANPSRQSAIDLEVEQLQRSLAETAQRVQASKRGSQR